MDEIRTHTQPHAEAEDASLAVVPGFVKSAGGVLMMTGVFGLLHVVQLFGIIVRLRGPFVVAPPAMAVEALAAVVTGIGFVRVRSWAPSAAILTAGLLWVTSGAWFVFAITEGLITLFGMLVPVLAFVSLILCLVWRKRCAAIAGARRRLEEQGFELGT
jgi:hypothetical protein